MPERQNLKKWAFGQCPRGEIQKSCVWANARKAKFEKVGVWANAREAKLPKTGFGQAPERQNRKKQRFFY